VVAETITPWVVSLGQEIKVIPEQPLEVTLTE